MDASSLIALGHLIVVVKLDYPKVVVDLDYLKVIVDLEYLMVFFDLAYLEDVLILPWFWLSYSRRWPWYLEVIVDLDYLIVVVDLPWLILKKLLDIFWLSWIRCMADLTLLKSLQIMNMSPKSLLIVSALKWLLVYSLTILSWLDFALTKLSWQGPWICTEYLVFVHGTAWLAWVHIFSAWLY